MMANSESDLIVFHRNLRIQDNEALSYGSIRQNYKCIYVFDEAYWSGNGKSLRQLYFLKDCLRELDNSLKKINSKLEIFIGNYKEFHKSLINNKFTLHFNYSTDIEYYKSQFTQFLKLAKQQYEIKVYNDFGVQRENFDRDQWSRFWENQMNKPLCPEPKINKASHDHNYLSTHTVEEFINKYIDIQKPDFIEIQPGGSSKAEHLLETFFNERCNGYRTKMSNPFDAKDSCSRLSPHFSFGTISIRYVYQKLKKEYFKSNFKSDLYSFKKRLHWHCHFIQKFEAEPDIEYNSMHSMCDNLRPTEDQELIEKWIKGETGYPFLDACIHHLRRYGWINFRMRAMIMSFASYNLWQPWQKTSPLLAELFVDYEPGIHISQVQMQSGVTGINLPRIYSVIKQSRDQDPEASFIRKELPELSDESNDNIHNATLDVDYPNKIVDLRSSSANARDKIWGIRKSDQFKKIAKEVYIKHGSRMRQRRR